MPTLPSLWIPILASAVLVFIVSSLIHMLLKWHNSDYQALTNEEEVRAAIRKGTPAPGQYVMPHCPGMKEMASPEAQKRFAEGPIAMLWIKANGLPSMGAPLAGWFLFNLVLSFCIAYLLSRTLATDTPGLQVFRVAATIAFLVHAGGAFPGAIWMGKPWRAAAKEVVDGLLYGLATGAAFACLWPR